MAYSRDPYYVYQDGVSIHIYGPDADAAVPLEHFDELVVMRFAQLLQTPERLHEVMVKTLENHYGNMGCDELAKLAGRPGVMDLVREELNL